MLNDLLNRSPDDLSIEDGLLAIIALGKGVTDQQVPTRKIARDVDNAPAVGLTSRHGCRSRATAEALKKIEESHNLSVTALAERLEKEEDGLSRFELGILQFMRDIEARRVLQDRAFNDAIFDLQQVMDIHTERLAKEIRTIRFDMAQYVKTMTDLIVGLLDARVGNLWREKDYRDERPEKDARDDDPNNLDFC